MSCPGLLGPWQDKTAVACYRAAGLIQLSLDIVQDETHGIMLEQCRQDLPDFQSLPSSGLGGTKASLPSMWISSLQLSIEGCGDLPIRERG